MVEDVNIKLNWTPIKRRWIVIRFLLILLLFLPNLRQALFCTNRTARPPINSVAFLPAPAPPLPLPLLDQNPKFHGNYEILCRRSPSLHHNHQLSLLFFPITGRECWRNCDDEIVCDNIWNSVIVGVLRVFNPLPLSRDRRQRKSRFRSVSRWWLGLRASDLMITPLRLTPLSEGLNTTKYSLNRQMAFTQSPSFWATIPRFLTTIWFSLWW